MQPRQDGGSDAPANHSFCTLAGAVFYFGLSLAAFSFAASPAWAQFYVRSPEVEKGVAEIEEHGAFYSGPGEDERLWQTHELEGKYGITDLFGVSDAVSDLTYKIDLEVEF